MLFKGVLQRMGMAARESKSETETSEDYIPALDEEVHIMAKGNKKPKAAPDTPASVPEVSTSTTSPVSSPKIPFEVLALSVEAVNKENHTMVKGKKKTKVISDASPLVPEESTNAASPATSLKISFENLALSAEVLDKENRTKANGKKQSKATTEISSPGSEDSTKAASPAPSPKMLVQNPALSFDTPSGSDSEAAMNSNKNTTLEKPRNDAEELVADHSATWRMESYEDIGVANFGDLTIHDAEPGDKFQRKDVPQKFLEAELATPAVKKNNSRKKKKKKKKKKPAVPNMTSSSSSSFHSTVTAPANSSRKASLVLKARLGFDEYRNELKCRRHGCGKLTNCYDGSTVICPRCGVKSFLRYCSLECLLHPDMAFHWAQECGTCPIGEESLPLVDKSTLIIRPAAMRPYIECEARDNPARHRQAVFHSSNAAAGDYFVFNDNSLLPTGLQGQVAVIGAGEIIAVVTIIPDYGLYQGHSIFHEILEDCLRRGFSRPDKCLALVDLITKQLVFSRQWSQEVQGCLVFQMRNEFAYEIPQEMLLRFRVMGPASA